MKSRRARAGNPRVMYGGGGLLREETKSAEVGIVPVHTREEVWQSGGLEEGRAMGEATAWC